MKNSSRLAAVIARNFTRSSRGWEPSRAWHRTRSLNSSQLSSRLMYSAGTLEVRRIEFSVGDLTRNGWAFGTPTQRAASAAGARLVAARRGLFMTQRKGRGGIIADRCNAAGLGPARLSSAGPMPCEPELHVFGRNRSRLKPGRDRFAGSNVVPFPRICLRPVLHGLCTLWRISTSAASRPLGYRSARTRPPRRHWIRGQGADLLGSPPTRHQVSPEARRHRHGPDHPRQGLRLREPRDARRAVEGRSLPLSDAGLPRSASTAARPSWWLATASRSGRHAR